MKNSKNIGRQALFGLIFSMLCVNIADYLGISQKAKLITGIAAFIYYVYLTVGSSGKPVLEKIGEHAVNLFAVISGTLLIVRVVSWTGLKGMPAIALGFGLLILIACIVAFVALKQTGNRKDK